MVKIRKKMIRKKLVTKKMTTGIEKVLVFKNKKKIKTKI